MEAIAVEAGITRPILYRHFGDVAGLYETLAERYAADLLTAMREVGEGLKPGRELIRAQVESYLGFLERDPNLYRFLTRQFPSERPDAQEAVTGFVQLLGRLVAGYLEGLGMPAMTAATSGRAFVGSVQAAGEWWLCSSGVERSVVADELADFLWHGLQGTKRVEGGDCVHSVS